MLFFWAPPPPPVSYSAEVAPIFALHCNTCHGEAGRFSTRTHQDLMAGGNLGRLIIPGDPGKSLLLHFIDGRRGKGQRMPLNAPPLSPGQINLIRRWIAEGAQEDPDTTPKYTYAVRGISTGRTGALRISWQPVIPSYMIATVREAGGRVLLSEVFSATGVQERLTWDIRPERGWPRVVEVEVTVRYSPSPPSGISLSVTRIPAER